MQCFFDRSAKDINRARLDHFSSLNLISSTHRVLEVGCGPVGYFTNYLEKHCKEVISVDARQSVIEEHVNRYPHRKNRLKVIDLNMPGALSDLGNFDLVFCYGLLYHLGNPKMAIKNMAKVGKTLIVCTLSNPVDNMAINYCSEDKSDANQSYCGKSCRPARDWVMRELYKFYKYVYHTKTQPRHIEFPLNWPQHYHEDYHPNISTYNTRAVFVASHNHQDNPLLSSVLLNEQSAYIAPRANIISKIRAWLLN